MTARWMVLGSHIPASGRLGGMIRYTVEVLRSLEARPNVEAHVHCQPDAVPFLRDALGIDQERLHSDATGSTLRDSVTERFGMTGLVDRLRPDVVLGTKQLVPRKVGDEIRVLTVHDLLPFDRPGDFGMAKRLLLPRVYRRCLHEADVLACVSSATRDRLLACEPTTADRAVVIPNAFASTLVSAPPEPLPELGDRRFALVVGDRSNRKNLAFLVGLWPRVLARRPDAHLVVVGPPGWGRNQHLPLLDDLIRTGSASSPGMIPDGQLRWAFEHATVTLCPSLLEGFGLPVVEALALGCRVVLSADPAQVEVAQGRGTVISVDRPEEWVEAIVEHFEAPGPVVSSLPPRRWDDVAAELISAVEEHRSRHIGTRAVAG